MTVVCAHKLAAHSVNIVTRNNRRHLIPLLTRILGRNPLAHAPVGWKMARLQRAFVRAQPTARPALMRARSFGSLSRPQRRPGTARGAGWAGAFATLLGHMLDI